MSSPQATLSSTFIGTAICFVLHGITCSQTVWYFRTQSGRTSKWMKAFILLICLAGTLNCVFTLLAVLNSLALAYAKPKIKPPCRQWVITWSYIYPHRAMLAQIMTTGMCTLCVEGFFVVRMWRLSQHKVLTALASIPLTTGHAFGIVPSKAQVVRSLKVRCDPKVSELDNILIFGSYGCRLFADCVVCLTMCYMIYVRSIGITRHANTVKIVHGLILWMISTGLLTCLNTVLYLICYLEIGNSPPAIGVYYVRGGLYANAMLAQLNARARYRAMAEATIPLDINLTALSLNHAVNREGNDNT